MVRFRAMEHAAHYIDSATRELIRDLIAENSGNEVFFQAVLDQNNVVCQAELVARGGPHSVAAKLNLTNPFRVVIHNHPSGLLEPSPEDLNLSSRFLNQEIAFYIIDNTVDNLFAVIPPASSVSESAVDTGWIKQVFADDGELSRIYEGYEYRSSQTEMAVAVGEIINNKKHGMIEAPTGTGKSLAYLLPLSVWAQQNKKRALICTHTLNLQQQLIDKDIPTIQKLLPEPVKYSIVKGRGHYLCLKKLYEFRQNRDDNTLLTFKDNEVDDFDTIAAWAETTATGLFSELHIISPALQEELGSDSDSCAGYKCPYNGSCFFRIARREAAESHLLIANHAIFFTDMQIRGNDAQDAQSSVFPACHRIVLDEAHNLEDVATRFFGMETGTVSILYRLKRLVNGGRGYLKQFTVELLKAGSECRPIIEYVENELTEKVTGLTDWINERSNEIQLLFDNLSEKKSDYALRITPQISSKIRNDRDSFLLLRSLADKCGMLSKKLMQLLELTLDLSTETREQIEGRVLFLYRQGARFKSDSSLISSIMGAESAEDVYWLEKSKNRFGTKITFNKAPVSVAEVLYDLFLSKYEGVVYTSATLTVSDSFSFFERRLGLHLLPMEKKTFLELPAMFDYRNRALLSIPQDLPVPVMQNINRYVEMFSDFAVELTGISRGRIFFLFTSWRLLEQCYNATVAKMPESWKINCMQQRGGIDRNRLLEEFKSTPDSVLFGVNSFWEGVDVKGSRLIAVVITKLPFEVPSDPLVEARNEQIKASGGDPFKEISIPKAVIRLKQGFGRLIRTGSDYGGVFILDTRIIRRIYGKTFFKSLPKAANVTGSYQETLQVWKKFLEKFESQ